jgi:hypothetical protein
LSEYLKNVLDKMSKIGFASEDEDLALTKVLVLSSCV